MTTEPSPTRRMRETRVARLPGGIDAAHRSVRVHNRRRGSPMRRTAMSGGLILAIESSCDEYRDRPSSMTARDPGPGSASQVCPARALGGGIVP